MLIQTTEQAMQAIAALRGTNPIAFDVETTGLHVWSGHRICGVALYSGGQPYYFPFRHKRGVNLDIGLLPLLSSLLHRRLVIGHNIAFDISMLKEDTKESPEDIFDTMVAAYILNENEPNYRLKDSEGSDGGLADRYVQRDASNAERQMVAKLNMYGIGKEKMFMAPPDMVSEYAESDVVLTYKLFEYQKPKLNSIGLSDLAKEYFNYSLILNRMTTYGIKIDTQKVEILSDQARKKAYALLEDICRRSGRDLNPNSPKQVCEWLKISSSAEEVLESLHTEDAKLLVEYRKWTKANSTYFDRYLEVMDKNHVIHTNFNITGTVSGRLSCSNPNLQAVPRKATEYKVKDVFIPRDGMVLFSLDYSQAEIRVGAHYAKEQGLMDALKNGEDVHTKSATLMGIPRDAAKRMNFGVIYGIGAESLSNDLKITERQARSYLDKYHAAYPGFRRLYRECERVAMERGYIKMFTGRRRNFNTPEAEPHKAMSNLIQGTVAEIMRVAIQNVVDLVESAGGHLLLQVHDDLIGEIPADQFEKVVPEIRQIMEDFDFNVPITTEVKFSPNDWGNMTKWSK